MARKKKNRRYNADFAVMVADGFYAVGLRTAKDCQRAEGDFGFKSLFKKSR